MIYDRYNIYSRKGEHIGEVGQYSPQDAAKFAAFAYQRERSDLVVVRTADDKGVEQTRAAILDAESRMSH